MLELQLDIYAPTHNPAGAPGAGRGVTTNGITKANGAAVMGAGVAKTVRDLYPGIDQKLGQLLREKGNHVHLLMSAPVNIFSFPTKHHWRDNSDPALIARSASELVALVDAQAWDIVYLPRPGCNNGKLNWNTVAALLKPLFDERFIICTKG